MIQQLATYGSDQPLDERVRYRHMGYGLDLAHVKNAQIGLPAMKLEQRIVVATDMLRQCRHARDDLIEHSTQGGTIDRARLHGKADDAPG